MKRCKKCEIEKELTDFHKAKSNDGYMNICKSCKLENENIVKICQKCGINKKLNEFKINGRAIDGRTNICVKCSRKNEKTQQCVICKHTKEMQEKIYNKNGEKIISYTNTCIECYHEKEIIRGRIKGKKNYRNRDEKAILRDKEKNKNYRKNNKEKIKKLQNEGYKKFTSLQKLRLAISNNIRMSLKTKGYKKKTKTADILGCTIEDFKKYLENKFDTWMNWENRGLYNGELNYGWDIDHIIPLSSAKTEEEMISLNHYTNLQPLCSYINRNIKRNLLEYTI